MPIFNAATIKNFPLICLKRKTGSPWEGKDSDEDLTFPWEVSNKPFASYLERENIVQVHDKLLKPNLELTSPLVLTDNKGILLSFRAHVTRPLVALNSTSVIFFIGDFRKYTVSGVTSFKQLVLNTQGAAESYLTAMPPNFITQIDLVDSRQEC